VINRVYLAAMRNGPLVMFALAVINTVVTALWALGTNKGFMGIILGLNSSLIPFIAALVLYRFDRWQAGAQ